jgi:hypothetical protein
LKSIWLAWSFNQTCAISKFCNSRFKLSQSYSLECS